MVRLASIFQEISFKNQNPSIKDCKDFDTFMQWQSELQTRHKQYEYYRNKLLTLEYLESNGDYELKTLWKIDKFIRGIVCKKDLLDSINPLYSLQTDSYSLY